MRGASECRVAVANHQCGRTVPITPVGGVKRRGFEKGIAASAVAGAVANLRRAQGPSGA